MSINKKEENNQDVETGAEEVTSGKMTLVEHLSELRTRIIICLSSWVIASIVGWYVSIPALTYFKAFPSLRDVQLILIRPTEAIMIRLKVALVIGFLIAFPVLIYQLLAFVLPGLTGEEKKWIRRLIPGSVALFYGGAAFAIFAMLPITLYFLIVNMAQGLATPQISLEEYVNFLIMLIILGGVVFQTPIVLLFLTMLGIVTSDQLRKGRRYAIVIIFIIAAVASPPDAFSQIVVAIPMLILFEISIWLAKISGK